MLNYYHRFPQCMWRFIIYIVRGINGQLITVSPPFKFVGETSSMFFSLSLKVH